MKHKFLELYWSSWSSILRCVYNHSSYFTSIHMVVTQIWCSKCGTNTCGDHWWVRWTTQVGSTGAGHWWHLGRPNPTGRPGPRRHRLGHLFSGTEQRQSIYLLYNNQSQKKEHNCRIVNLSVNSSHWVILGFYSSSHLVRDDTVLQVHLERDPRECYSSPAPSTKVDHGTMKPSPSTTEKLSTCNQARLEMLRDLLASELGLDTSISATASSSYTPAYFLGRHEVRHVSLTRVYCSIFLSITHYISYISCLISFFQTTSWRKVCWTNCDHIWLGKSWNGRR